jgi:hypothetical protein
MTAFAEQLRSDLTARQTKARGARERKGDSRDAAVLGQAAAERQAAEERLTRADRAGQTLLAEIFRPLVEDFKGVMESLGVLDSGALACEAGPALPSGSGKKKRVKGKTHPARPLATNYRAFLADHAVRGLPPPSPDNPTKEMAEFSRFLAGQQQSKSEAEATQIVPQWRRLAYRAHGTDDGKHYEIRLVAAPTTTGPNTGGLVELWCDCLSGSASDFRRDSAPALIELPRKRASVQSTDHDAARQWCQNVLSQSAAAIMEATMGVFVLKPGGVPEPAQNEQCSRFNVQ